MGTQSSHLSANGRRGAIALVGCLLLAAAAVAPSLASRGVTANKNVAFPADTQRAATATCPPRTHATGGGFQVAPAGSPMQFSAFTSNSSFASRRSWSVTSGRFFNAPSGVLTSSVRCERKRDGKVPIILPGSVTIAAPDQVTQAAGANLIFHCPPTTHPVGGGYSVNKPFHPDDPGNSNKFVASQNRRTGANAWTISGFLIGGPQSDDAVFTGKVACERNGSRPIREKSKTVPFPGTTGRSTASVTCPKGRHLVSGGFAFAPREGDIPVPFVDQNVPQTNRTWTVGAHQYAFAAPPGSSMTTYGYCRRNRPRPRRAGGASASSAPLGSGWVEVVRTGPVTLG